MCGKANMNFRGEIDNINLLFLLQQFFFNEPNMTNDLSREFEYLKIRVNLLTKEAVLTVKDEKIASIPTKPSPEPTPGPPITPHVTKDP